MLLLSQPVATPSATHKVALCLESLIQIKYVVQASIPLNQMVDTHKMVILLLIV